jgi:hypothetical protein
LRRQARLCAFTAGLTIQFHVNAFGFMSRDRFSGRRVR